MKVRRLIAVALAAGLLTGCFEADQDLIVEKDGAATFKTRMAMEASLLQMSESDLGFCAPEDSAAVDGVSMKHERHTEGSMEVCVVTASGPLDRLAEWIEQADHGPAAGDEEMAKGPAIALLRDGSDYVFSVHIEGTPMEAADDKEMMEEMKPMIMAAFAGRSLDWSVTAPEILDTSGQLSEDGKTASYSIPMAKLLGEGPGEHAFEVRFSLKSPGLIKRLLGN